MTWSAPSEVDESQRGRGGGYFLRRGEGVKVRFEHVAICTLLSALKQTALLSQLLTQHTNPKKKKEKNPTITVNGPRPIGSGSITPWIWPKIR